LPCHHHPHAGRHHPCQHHCEHDHHAHCVGPHLLFSSASGAVPPPATLHPATQPKTRLCRHKAVGGKDHPQQAAGQASLPCPQNAQRGCARARASGAAPRAAQSLRCAQLRVHCPPMHGRRNVSSGMLWQPARPVLIAGPPAKAWPLCLPASQTSDSTLLGKSPDALQRSGSSRTQGHRARQSCPC